MKTIRSYTATLLAIVLLAQLTCVRSVKANTTGTTNTAIGVVAVYAIGSALNHWSKLNAAKGILINLKGAIQKDRSATYEAANLMTTTFPAKTSKPYTTLATEYQTLETQFNKYSGTAAQAVYDVKPDDLTNSNANYKDDKGNGLHDDTVKFVADVNAAIAAAGPVGLLPGGQLLQAKQPGSTATGGCSIDSITAAIACFDLISKTMDSAFAGAYHGSACDFVKGTTFSDVDKINDSTPASNTFVKFSCT